MKFTVYDIRQATDEALKALPLAERFDAVHALVREVGEKHISYMRPHIEDALYKLSRSIRHSPRYIEFLENSLDMTLEYITCDPELLNNISAFNVLSDRDRERVINEVGHQQGLAFGDQCQLDIGLLVTDTKFFQQAQGPRGYYQFDQQKPDRGVNVNMLTDANAKYGYMHPLSNRIHEGVHQIGWQLAHHFKAAGKEKLGDLAYDAELYATLEAANAIIPGGVYGLYAAYRAQFHEVVAFDQQDRFMARLPGILGLEALTFDQQHRLDFKEQLPWISRLCI